MRADSNDGVRYVYGLTSLPDAMSIAARRFVLPLAICVLFCHLAVAGDRALAIKGYDPVAYFTLQRATPGVAQFEYDWDEHRWQFSSAHHFELFKADPVRYAPQFASFCAVALARGEVLEANPEYWLISDGKLYLFGKPVGPDIFRKNLNQNIQRANEHRSILPKN
jgi:YHS domain-containing protein